MKILEERLTRGVKIVLWITAMLGTLHVAEPACAEKKHPAEEKGVAALKSDVATTIEFRNFGPQAFKIYRLDTEGKRVLVGLLKPGEARTESTFLTHPWLLTDEQDNARGLYYPDAQKRVVTGDLSFPGPSGGPPSTFSRQTAARRFKSVILENSQVQEELKITPEQAEKIKTLVDSRTRALQTLSGVPIAEQTPKLEELRKENDSLAVGLLTESQRKRFDQIVRQQLGASLYTDSDLWTALHVTPEQQEKLQSLRTQYTNQSRALPFPSDVKQIVELRRTLIEKAIGILSDEQKQIWKDLVGDLFPGVVSSRLPGAPRTDASRLFVDFRRQTFGLYLAELTFLSANSSMQTELKMTADQMRLAKEAADAVRQKFTPSPSPPGMNYTERSKFVEDSIRTILTPDQSARFRQIMLQSYEPRTSPPAVPTTRVMSAAAYPGVAAELKLTDEQKQRLIAGEAAAQVLTPEQNAAIAKMLGEPFKGDFTVPRSSTVPRSN